MRKLERRDALHGLRAPGLGDGARGDAAARAHRLDAPDVHKRDAAALAGLEPHRGPGGDGEPPAVRALAVEAQRGVGLDEVKVRADLHRPIARVGHGDRHVLPPRVQLDRGGVGWQGGPRGAGSLGVAAPLKGRQLRHGKERALQRQRQVPVLERDGQVHREQLGAVGKRGLHLHIRNHFLRPGRVSRTQSAQAARPPRTRRHPRQHLPPAKHATAHCRELHSGIAPCNRRQKRASTTTRERGAITLADQFHQLRRDECRGLGLV